MSLDRSPLGHNTRQIRRVAKDPNAVLKVKLLVEDKKVVGFKFDAVKEKR